MLNKVTELELNLESQEKVNVLLTKMIQSIKDKEYILDLTTDDMYKIQEFLGSGMNSDAELGSELVHLLTGADERKRYFEP